MAQPNAVLLDSTCDTVLKRHNLITPETDLGRKTFGLEGEVRVSRAQIKISLPTASTPLMVTRLGPNTSYLQLHGSEQRTALKRNDATPLVRVPRQVPRFGRLQRYAAPQAVQSPLLHDVHERAEARGC